VSDSLPEGSQHSSAPTERGEYTPPRTDGLATASFICGLLALFCVLGPLAGIPAIICGCLSARRVSASRGAVGGSGLALAGFILGCVGALVWTAAGYAVYKKMRGPLAEIGSMFDRVEESAWIANVATRVRTYRTEVGDWPTKQSIGAEELDAASVLAAFQSREDAGAFIPAERIKDGRLVDRWKRPLHIAADLDGNGHVAIGTGEVEDMRVLVWSDGPNGKNDYGEGDDIRSW
jgi:hypothetical protein